MHHACPRHALALMRHRIDAADTWRCETCDGLWLPGTVVATVVGNAPRWPARAATDATALCCPDDGTSLRAVDADGIELDLCARCHGLWLDRGELAHILRRARGEDDPAERLAEALLDELESGSADAIDRVATRPARRPGRDTGGETDGADVSDVAGDALSAVLEFIADVFGA
ncbi:zf-TFIIB domain-containing protein [Chiayiivirga flava]|uniref:Zn-finger nucleic acid-binding protein n=1 Tax=Chiayiivirga flava TaxID=659595 RepID=A0A7W8D5Q9_9GAMM|nr:zf-TFIIB domain-containing protein [Chiayiivirga flava]MBB5208406.1 Zn-finger nucleic acid-binding protein [Chiayiivirga flava]